MGRVTLLLETMSSTMLSGLSTLRCARSFATMVVKPHVPMIKFRKNQPQTETNLGSTEAPAIATPGVYEWWEIPSKFSRPTIDQSECDVINMGGGDKLW